MSEHGWNCPECGGSNGIHFDDCIYEGTSGPVLHRSGSGKRSSGSGAGALWIIGLLAVIIASAINELLGAIVLFGIVFFASLFR